MTMTEQQIQLAIAARNGDIKSFEQLYAIYCEKVYSFARMILRNETDAEDVLQEAFITAWRKLDTLETPEAFSVWIQVIAKNLCYMQLRRKNIAILLDAEQDIENFDIEDSDDFLPAVYTERSDLKERFGRIIDGLSDVQRQAIVLFYFNELSVDEISKIMECSPGTVKTRLFLARKAIKAEVEEQERKTGQKFYGIAGIPMLPLGKLVQSHMESQSIGQSAANVSLNAIRNSISNTGGTGTTVTGQETAGQATTSHATSGQGVGSGAADPITAGQATSGTTTNPVTSGQAASQAGQATSGTATSGQAMTGLAAPGTTTTGQAVADQATSQAKTHKKTVNKGMANKLSTKAKIAAGISIVAAVCLVVVLLVILFGGGAGNTAPDVDDLTPGAAAADSITSEPEPGDQDTDPAGASETTDGQTAPGGQTTGDPGLDGIDLSAAIAKLPGNEALDEVYAVFHGYWITDDYPFVGFVYMDGVPGIDYGLFQTSFKAGGKVTDSQATGEYEMTLILFVPAAPATVMDAARPERTEKVFIDASDFNQHNTMKIKIENLGDGGWHDYKYGGAIIEEAAEAFENR